MPKSNQSSSNIGKVLVRAFILHSCIRQPKSGYRLLVHGKSILLTSWSAGSFYPHLRALLHDGMLARKQTSSKRVTYEYSTTKKGREYLAYVSSYFKNEDLRAFFTALMSDDFDK